MSLATPRCVQKLQTASPRILINPGGVCLFREPDAGNLPVRFDEREQEIESSQTGLRRAMRKHSNSHREAKATAPVLDSTRDYAQNPLAAAHHCALGVKDGAAGSGRQGVCKR
jgi:hypothetical protein